MLYAPHDKALHLWFTVVVSVVLSITATLIVVERTQRALRPKDADTHTAVISMSQDEEVRHALERVRPAVVSVVVKKDVGADSLFRPLNEPAGPVAVGGGSGFIIRDDGLVVTNRHVVTDDKATYTVVLGDAAATEFPAHLVGKDPVLDIAVLKIDAHGLATVTLGNSDELFVGQTVLAIGNSLAQFEDSATKGIISGLRRQVLAGDDFGQNGETLEGAIQTDAAINPGNSGGPLIDLAGNVVGVNTAVSTGGQLVGFALPINSVKRIINTAITQGKIVHPWVGMRFRFITPEVQKEEALPRSAGALITHGDNANEPAIAPKSPAEAAGLREGDIIIKINNTDINETHSPAVEIAKYSVDDTIQVTVVRDGKEKIIPVTLAEFPQGEQ